MRRRGAIEERHLTFIYERRKEKRRLSLKEALKRYSETYRRILDAYERARIDSMISGTLSRFSTLKMLEHYFDDLVREQYRRIERFIGVSEAVRELFSLISDSLRFRAKVLFKVSKQYFFHQEKTSIEVVDELLMHHKNRDRIVEALMQSATAKMKPEAIIRQYPEVLHFLRHYILYYKKFPCRHVKFAFKVTPVTLQIFKNYRLTYYVLRWTPVDNLREPLLKSTRGVDLYFMLQARKPYYEVLNTLTVIGEGTANYSEKVVIGRDDRRRGVFPSPLRRLVFQTHLVKRIFAKLIGKAENYFDVHHCSVYAIPIRKSKSLKLYESGFLFYGKRARRRFKDATYYEGLRV